MRGFYTAINKTTWREINGIPGHYMRSEYNGCDGHYNERGHGVLAGAIAPQLAAALGW